MDKIKRDIIIDFFSKVCQGIRSEYENGASFRDVKKDLHTLEALLDT